MNRVVYYGFVYLCVHFYTYIMKYTMNIVFPRGRVQRGSHYPCDVGSLVRFSFLLFFFRGDFNENGIESCSWARDENHEWKLNKAIFYYFTQTSLELFSILSSFFFHFLIPPTSTFCSFSLYSSRKTDLFLRHFCRALFCGPETRWAPTTSVSLSANSLCINEIHEKPAIISVTEKGEW